MGGLHPRVSVLVVVTLLAAMLEGVIGASAAPAPSHDPSEESTSESEGSGDLAPDDEAVAWDGSDDLTDGAALDGDPPFWPSGSGSFAGPVFFGDLRYEGPAPVEWLAHLSGQGSLVVGGVPWKGR